MCLETPPHGCGYCCYCQGELARQLVGVAMRSGTGRNGAGGGSESHDRACPGREGGWYVPTPICACHVLVM